ncbi:hypothetical protein [Methylobacterium aquaticum]|uniref:hypothetical protein n=1 Tax=Methylobacterium aquaticum TaxID=270351 RepID=UPI001931FCE2|nr:hypothetical protein [Methylobacterium aquaticum]QRE76507.1 hypothetical protein F1D61_25660 [Methylobacterium aquaticum]
MACNCLHCTLGKVINERFPDGVGPEEASEIATNLAALTGGFLADVSDRSVEVFIAAMRSHRDRIRSDLGIRTEGLH